MCNHYSSSGEYRDRMGEFAHLKLPIFDHLGAKPNVPTHVYPGRMGEIVKVEGDKLAASAASWRLIPKWHRGSIKDFEKKWRGCNNARSEGIASSGMFKSCLGNRCLIPADAFFEYAAAPGPDGKKVEYEFRPADGRVLWIAGLWEASGPSDGPMSTYAMVMTSAGPDALSIGHQRSPIFLAPERMAEWLDPMSDIQGFTEPPHAGSFRLEVARKPMSGAV